MTRIIIVRETENGKAVYLYGGDNRLKCLKDIFDVVEHGDTMMYHSNDRNNILDNLKLNN